MSKTVWTSVGTIGAALVASSCCIGPVIFAVLGLGAFGAGAVLERFRPVFMGLTFLTLGVAFFLTYRKRSGSCADGHCEVRGASKWSKIALWIVAVFALVFLSFPEWSPLLLKAQPEVFGMNQPITLKVYGMTCGGCAVNVQRALAGVPGVAAASVDFESATATVKTTPSGPSVDSLIVAVQKAGYQATSLMTVPATSVSADK